MNGRKFSGVGTIAMALAMATASVSANAQSVDAGASAPKPSDRPIETYGGNIDPFGGNLDPFRGNIDPFRGNLDPFRGNLDPFRGNLDPFRGNLDPFRGNLDPFYAPTAQMSSGTVGAFWGQFGSKWVTFDNSLKGVNGAAVNGVSLANANATLNDILSDSEQFWGERVRLRTGKSFNAGFADPILAKYGISRTDPASLASLTAAQRSKLVFDLYDGLSSFSGTDRIDHWMSTVRWNPTLTKIQGSGADATIGLLDSSVASDDEVKVNLIASGGYSANVNGHGSGVASLLIAPHDGKGLQGIAPKARLVAYNPFDDSGTASWADIRTGIAALRSARASVINISLGVKGFTLNPEWANVFKSPEVIGSLSNTVFVVAAGNNGTRQTQNINWQFLQNPALIVVGSIDPSENISSFSNTPGSACLLSFGICSAGKKLADRFIVAPGEALLVSDGRGGTTRVSGTSFAAPLVSGAITLLHDRWPWLAQNPEASAQIILSTARDLGAPGTDEIYGRGVLDVEASQSPLNFANLSFYEFNGTNTKGKRRTAADVQKGGIKSTWEASGTYYYLIENIGTTYRDFAVPLSTRLIGQKTGVGGTQEYFQSYVEDRLTDWINGAAGFSDARSFAAPIRGGWGFAIEANNLVGYTSQGAGLRSTSNAPHTAVKLVDPSGQFAFSIGNGEGARSIGGQQGFGLRSDYSATSGGVNPLLGLASGGSFMDAGFAVAKNTSVSVGFTQKRLDHSKDATLSSSERQQLQDVADYQASAINMRVTQHIGAAITVTADYTKLREKNGLLGVQSREASDLRSGSSTETATLGANFSLPNNFAIAASATSAKTRSGGQANQALATSGSGVLSSAYAVSLSKKGIVGRRDILRFSATQPLHIESGKLAFTSLQVVDRNTGELGQATQNFDISGKNRRFTGELLYATPMTGNGEVSLFGRAEYASGSGGGIDGMVIGGRVRLGF
jgi:hypothetical protein